jgi:hypothetical protein
MSLAGAIERGEVKGYEATYGDKKEKTETSSEKLIREAIEANMPAEKVQGTINLNLFKQLNPNIKVVIFY